MNGAASSAHGVGSMFSAAAGTAPAAAFIGAGGKRSRDDEGAMDEDDDYGGDDPQCGATGDDKIHDSAGGFHSSSFYFRPQLARGKSLMAQRLHIILCTRLNVLIRPSRRAAAIRTE